MRIAVWHNLPSGGGKRALYDHVRGLVARGHKVEAWCPPTADRDFLPLSVLVPEHVVDLVRPAYRFSDQWQITLWIERRIAAMEDHCRKCADEIQRKGFDILLAHSCQFFAAPSIGRYVDIPSILYLHEPYRPFYEALPQFMWAAPPASSRSLPNYASWKSAFVDWRLIRNSRVQAREEVNNATAFTRILVNSLFTRESVMRAYGLDSDVCYLGIDTDHFVNMDLPKGNFIVGVGSIQLAKNVRFCIEAMGALSAPRPKLVWIGNMCKSNYLEEMRTLAKSLRVEFEPRVAVTDAELLDTLNRAIAMVYAPRLEPFGLAPLEANACGVPVIAVAEGGVRETVVDQINGLIVRNEPVAMAAAIERLRADPALAFQLGASGRSQVEAKWGLNAATDRLEGVLERYSQRA